MQHRSFSTLVSVVVWSLYTSAWSTPPLVTFDKCLIPTVDAPLPILALGHPATTPPELLKKFVRTVAPNATLTSDDTSGGQYAYDGDRLVAIYDAESGETRVFSNVGQLPPADGPICIDPAYEYVRNEEMFPVDHTTVSVVKGSNLVASTLERGHAKRLHNSSRSHVYMTHAIVQRNITSDGHTYSVCGPGSTASFGFGADGKTYSLSYLWKPAMRTNHTVKSHTTDVIYDSIVKQLTPTALAGVPVRVDGVDVCFYDSGASFIQPVYRFWATLHTNITSNVTTSPTRLLGYLPIGSKSPEPIPDLSCPPEDTAQPTTPVAPQVMTRTLEERLPSINVTDMSFVTTPNNGSSTQTTSYPTFSDPMAFWVVFLAVFSNFLALARTLSIASTSGLILTCSPPARTVSSTVFMSPRPKSTETGIFSLHSETTRIMCICPIFHRKVMGVVGMVLSPTGYFTPVK